MPYGLAVATLEFVQSKLNLATRWRVTCPLGTDISGDSDPSTHITAPKAGFTIKLFPLGPFRTFACDHAQGRIVSRWFPASATHRYEPYGLMLDEPVALVVDDGRLVDFEGPAGELGKLRQHYEHVGACFDIDPYVVHSWHGGTNPKIFYPDPPHNDLERWNGVLHSHPRYAHFHTCGAYNPGEIVVPVIDPSIRINDQPYWENGELTLLDDPAAQSLLDAYPGQERAFVMNRQIGL